MTVEVVVSGSARRCRRSFISGAQYPFSADNMKQCVMAAYMDANMAAYMGARVAASMAASSGC